MFQGYMPLYLGWTIIQSKVLSGCALDEMLLLLVLALSVQLCCCAPQSQPDNNQQQQSAPKSNSPNSPIPIIRQYEEVGGDGSFNYSYETGNGIRVEQGGYVKQVKLSQEQAADRGPNEPDLAEGSASVQVIHGSYSYTAPDGTEISVKYIADENGFQPIGDHIPTPPPIPPAILKSMSRLSKAEVGSVPSGGKGEETQKIENYRQNDEQDYY